MQGGNSQSPAEKLIMAIMDLVDRPVDLYARDGSVYSGIFYTASFEKEYGIVLKNAIMTKMGKSSANISANITEGIPISTLVIQSDDFVQVVVKKDQLPSEGVAGNDIEPVAGTVASSECIKSTSEMEKQINETRQIGDSCSEREHNGDHEEIVDDSQVTSLQLNSSIIQVKPVDERQPSGVSTSFSSVVDVASDARFHSLAASTEAVPSHGSKFKKSTQESKLNPEAQNFAPSFAKSEAEIPARQAITGMTNMQNNYHMAPTAVRPEVGIGPFASQYPVYGNGGPQYSQPVIGQMGSGMQPVRLAGQYPSVHAGPPYVQPNSPTVMVGPYAEYPWQYLYGQQVVGQHAYMQHPYVQHPYGHMITYDFVHGPAAIPPVPARPQVNPHQAQYPKNQGSVGGQALQLCMPPSFLTGGQQRFAVPSHFSLLQSRISANRRIPISGSNGIFNTKLS